MAGEVITAGNLEDAKEELRNIYRKTANSFTEITQEEYDSIEKDEREDSDNHNNIQKLGKESTVIDQAYYKYLPERQIAYRILLIHKNGDILHDFFMITPE